MKNLSFLLTIILFACTAHAQLYISAGSTFFIQPGGVVTVQGDVTGLTDVQGTGKVLLKGTVNQNVNMNGFTIPNLELDNTTNATLAGNTRIGSSLLFTNGKIFTSNFNLNLASVATVSGMGVSKFVETAGTGQVIKELTANVAATEIPLGAGTVYRPAFVTTTGTYSAANVGLKVLAVKDPNLPPSVSDYLNVYWPVTKTGVTGTVTVAGQYAASDVALGTAANLRGYFYVPTDWTSAGETHNGTTQISAPITAAAGDVTGIDKFNLISAKAFLQAAYVVGTGLMRDSLRSGTNLIPLSDPYRTAPYSTYFTQTNNPISETAASSVFADQTPASNNIVDWVFLELRTNVSPGNSVLETRSALIRKDGVITNVDGKSPVTFNNIASGAYTLSVRHRNHLGISTDPTAFQHTFSDVKSVAPLVDFTAATDAQIYGTSNAFKLSTDSKVLLWSGDANSNGTVKYSGTSSDLSAVLTQVLGISGNTSQLYNYGSAIGYFSGDVNMDRKIKYSGTSSDASVILGDVLAYPGNASGLYNYSAFTKQLPN